MVRGSTATSVVPVSPNTVTAGGTSVVTLQTKDQFGNELTAGGLAVAFSFTGGSSTASGGIAIGELRVVGGPEIFSGEAGYTVRALSGNYGTRRWRFFRVGVRSSVPLGSSGFHASARAALFVHVKGSGVPGTGSGKEAETRLTYVVPKTHLFLAVGYRVEGFTVNAARNARPEEMSGLLLGGGIRLAR